MSAWEFQRSKRRSDDMFIGSMRQVRLSLQFVSGLNRLSVAICVVVARPFAPFVDSSNSTALSVY